MSDCKATWWRQEGKAGHYVRCEMPAKYLPGKMEALDFSSAYLDGEHEDGSPRLAFPQQEGAAIWCLPGNATRGALMRGQQLNGTRVLVEVDDNYLTMPPHSTEWERKIDWGNEEDRHSREGHLKIVQNVADGIIVSTPFLEKRYSRTTDKPVYLCRNCVDPEDWVGVERPEDDGILRFGWGASNSHFLDAPLLKKAVDWLVKQDGVRVCFIGLHPGEYRHYKDAVDWIAGTNDLHEYRSILSYLDVGFAPVKRTDWSAARSDLKALEYSMAGAASIVSRNEPYDLWLKDDMPCLTATDAASFFKAAQWCVQHRDELKSIAKQAKEYVLAERTIKQNVWRWAEAVEG